MRKWQNIHKLIDAFSYPVIFRKIISQEYSESDGEPITNYVTVSLKASIQPIKKKGAIGGENETYLDVNADGNWEKGAFIMISKSDFNITIQDEIENLTINNRNYGDAFIDRIQDWSKGQGFYKVRVLLKSLFPTRIDF